MTNNYERLAGQLCIVERAAGGDEGRFGSRPSIDTHHPIEGISQPGSVELARGLYGPMLTFDADTIIGRSLRTSGTFQESKIREVGEFLARKHQFRPETFVDIGANIGTHLVFALKKAGYQEAFGVEPDINNYRLLVCNVLLNGLENCTSLFNLALSDEDGSAELELSTENFGDHRIRRTGDKECLSFGEDERKSYRVRKTHAGRWLADLVYNPLRTLIWIDTQGHEGHVFRGFLDDSSSLPPRYIVAEFWPYGLERAGGKYSYLEFLSQCDAVYDINAESWEQLGALSIDSLSARYDQMLADTTAVHYPHTDLLCIRAGQS